MLQFEPQRYGRDKEMGLKEQLQADTVAAMRSGEAERRDTLRMLLAAVKQEEVDQQVELGDDGVRKVLTKQAKQRRESIADAEQAGRLDLAAREQAELKVIEAYLPEMMSTEEVRDMAAGIIADLGAEGPQDMGRVMGKLMPQIQGRADGKIASDVVRQLLSS